MNTRTKRRTLIVLVLVVAPLLAPSAMAHHGSSDYDVSREVTIAGTVKEWKWTQPHTWVVLNVSRPGGVVEEWSGEGPPLQWAASRGWSTATLKAGESVRLVMYPARAQARGGLVKRIEPAGRDPLVVSRPWLDEK
jgi:hypothetical protein